MAKLEAKRNSKYRQVNVRDLTKGRRGKHHDLVVGILRELETLPPRSAMEIPLESVQTELANLRSAIHRASISKGLAIATLADEENFYVWKKSDTK